MGADALVQQDGGPSVQQVREPSQTHLTPLDHRWTPLYGHRTPIWSSNSLTQVGGVCARVQGREGGFQHRNLHRTLPRPIP